MPLPVSTPLKRLRDLAVLAEQEADFAAADADVARRNVDVRTDVPVQLRS